MFVHIDDAGNYPATRRIHRGDFYAQMGPRERIDIADTRKLFPDRQYCFTATDRIKYFAIFDE